MTNFSEKDKLQMQQYGISISSVEKQIQYFKTGFPYLNIVAPATINSGMIVFKDQQLEHYCQLYEQFKGSRIKFTPASGAATRMFKKLYDILDYLKSGGKLTDDNNTAKLSLNFIKSLTQYPFFDQLSLLLQKENIDIQSINEKNYIRLLQLFLTEEGLNYGNKPKGVLTFHIEKEGLQNYAKTAFEEQLTEAALYAAYQGVAKVHLTVSPEHQQLFVHLLNNAKGRLEKKCNVRFDVSYSIQSKSTDTIAVSPDNEPFRNNDGTLLFRPAGHGALLHNLNQIEEELIFIKTVDNVLPDSLKNDTTLYKKVLAGKLLEVAKKTHQYIEQLQSGKADIHEVQHYMEKELCIIFPDNLKVTSELLITLLNKPIRVCGMVKNEGEPGGGPFWVKNNQGFTTLQIIEQSQFNAEDKQQQEQTRKATHFNPVDLVCYVYDYKGRKFDLQKFIDESTGFISSKSKDGKVLKALELPGLWNGSMSDWITLFVEVPLSTFSPVKEIFDLLRPEHIRS